MTQIMISDADEKDNRLQNLTEYLRLATWAGVFLIDIVIILGIIALTVNWIRI